MDVVYILRLEESKDFTVQLKFDFQPLNIIQQFNFSLQLSDNLEVLFDKICMSISELSLSVKQGKGCWNKPIQLWDTNLECPVSKTLQCEEVFFKNHTSNLMFHISDKVYRVVVNCPWVESLLLPSSIMVEFPVCPNKIIIHFGHVKVSKFFWYMANLEQFKKDEWTEVSQGLMYTPSEMEVGCKIKVKCAPSNGMIYGAETEAVMNTQVQPGPGFCPFEARHEYTKEHLSSESFRFVSYNILANVYIETDVAKKETFPNCPLHALSLDYRNQLQLKELFGYNADIICLQEVDKVIFTNVLQCAFNNQDLEGIFSIKGGDVNEGLATFYSTEKFRLRDSYRIVLADEVDANPIFSDIWMAMNENKSLVKSFKDKPTVVQVLVLQSLGKCGEILVIGNCHLYFSSDAEYIRLLQGAMFLTYVGCIAEAVARNNPKIRVSMIMCGDFNSTPNRGIFTLMTKGHVPDDVIDWNCGENKIVSSLTLRHPYYFASAYGTPEYTNFTFDFTGCLDYIYYQYDKLMLKQIVPLPSDEEVQKHVALPSIVFPSDHLALIVDFGWK